MDPQRILVINVTRIGDTLFSSPAIRAIKEYWPNAVCDVLAHPKRAEVFENLPFINKVGCITKGVAPFLCRLFGPRYDVAFVYGFDQALVKYATRAATHVIAFKQTDPALNKRLFRCVDPAPFQGEHAIKQALRLPAAIGINAQNMRIAYFCTDDEKKWGMETLSHEGLGSGYPLIGLQVASFPTKRYRDWPIESFLHLCREIRSRFPNAKFLIFGGPEERTRTDWLKAELNFGVSSFAGCLTLRQTAALMSCIDLYVGVDTGPTHIMSSFDIPIVGLYHCLSSRQHTGPLQHPLDFCIDHPRTGLDCDETTSMADISVALVFDRVVEALAARRK
ncbi:MAG: glycosyltransferase family 9 protein [Georgfuchsia sp.]